MAEDPVPAATPEGEMLVRIGELARRAGIPPATLRAWERRYGVVEPERGESGYRLYSREDERRLRAMVELIAEGLAPAEAARRVSGSGNGGLSMGEPFDASILPVLRDGLLASLLAFDEEESDRHLDRATGALSVEAVVGEVVLPVLREIGERWSRDEVSVGQEHFASNLLRGRLLGMARGWGGGEGNHALLACPSGELHDLGVIAFGLLLRGRGWRISFLGGDTPAESILQCANTTRPDIVVVFSIDDGRLEAIEEILQEIAARSVLLLAGQGSIGDLCNRIGAAPLVGDPVDAAAAFAA